MCGMCYQSRDIHMMLDKVESHYRTAIPPMGGDYNRGAFMAVDSIRSHLIEMGIILDVEYD
jgi:hypothetical protein